ncbi:MAG TPA: extracellular solute-binding protein, partial [Phycisphaeraceae bacterium]
MSITGRLEGGMMGFACALLLAGWLAGWGPCAIGASAPAEQELVVWLTYRDRGLEAAFRLFEREHPGVRIVTSLGAGPTGMDPQKLITGIAGGSPPDVLIQDRFMVGEWASRGAFLPLNEWIDRSLRREQRAIDAQQALERGNADAARLALEAVIESLQPVGPGRLLSLAQDLRDDLLAGSPPTELTGAAATLVSLCQGVHPDAFYRACWEEASWGEGVARRVYAIPLSTDVRVLYYNEDLLEKAGLVDASGRARPPANWQELKTYAERLTERDATGRIARLGFAPNYGNSWLYLYGWLNGGQFMSQDGRVC